MTTSIKLTDTQRHVLEHAADQPDGRISWFPDHVKGGARQKVIDGLFNKALITRNGGRDWRVAAEGYDALGRARPRRLKAGVKGKPSTRDNSKQATVIQMLQRPEGATVRQICEATDWQAHTVRGTFAGAFKKKLGLTLTSEKPEGGERVYRIA